MAQNASQLNRKVLQNLRTSGSNQYIISKPLSDIVAEGEIIVQLGSGETTTKSEIATGLWTLAADGVTPVRFPSEKRVQDMISSGAVLEVDAIEEAVGLDSEGKLPSDWGGDSTTYIKGTKSIISGITNLDIELASLQDELDRTQVGAGLDTDGTYTASAGTKYISNATSLKDADTKLDTAISELSGIVTDLDFTLDVDENKVLDGLWQVDGKVSGTSKNITAVKLDGYTEGSVTKVAATDTLGEALGKLQHEINSMNKSGDAQNGHILTTVSEVSGVVSETKALLTDVVLSGYSKTNDTGAIADTDTLEAALSKLENTVSANAISNTDGSVNVTSSTTGTDINVNIKSDEKVIKKDGNGGLYTNLNLVKITTGLGATVKESYEFRDSDGNKIGESIDIAKDSHIVSITYNETTQKLIYKYLDASGVEQTTEVDMAHLILETEVENGIQSVNGKLSIKLDTTGDDTGDGKFLTVGADGLKLDGVQDAIDAAMASGKTEINTTVGGDPTNTHMGISASTAADGHTVYEFGLYDVASATELANLSDSVLNLDATVSGETADSHVAIEIVETDGKLTSVTLTGTDIASASALTAEITRAKAAETEIANLVGITGNEGSRSYDATGNYLGTGDDKTVKEDIQTLDSIIGSYDDDSTTATTYDVTFTTENTVAKSISDIKKAIDEAKSALTLSATDDKYIQTQVTSVDTGTTIGISAVTGSVVTATSSNSALVDSWDAKQNLVHELVDNTSEEGVNNWHVTKTPAADNNNGVTYDFTNLCVDCGTF